MSSMSYADVKKQAQWELAIEEFEKAVESEKDRLRNKKSWFPWRIKFININQPKGGTAK